MKKLKISLLLVGIVTLIGCGNLATKDEKAVDNLVKTEGMENQEGTNLVLQDMKIETAEEALDRLKKGNELYVGNNSEAVDISSDKRDELKNGQNPFAVVLSCSDSRVVTSHIFDTGLGDIFDIKLAGNVIDDLTLGSIEYGVEHLGIKLLVVMGHESCGAVTATYDNVNNGEEAEGKIADIIEKIEPAVKEANSIEEASHNNVYDVIEEIKNDEVISRLIEEGKLKIVPAYYNLNGQVEFLQEN